MSEQSDILSHFLPNTVLSLIFSEFLSVNDISRFDIAICNKKKRPQFLECIKCKSCILIQIKERNLDVVCGLKSDIIPWLKSRSIQIKRLYFPQITSDIEDKIKGLGGCINWIQVSGDNEIEDDTMSRMISVCPNLLSLSLVHCNNISDITISTVAEMCPKLIELNISGCNRITDAGIIRIAENCSNLQGFRSCYKLTDESLIRILESCPIFHSLDISGCHEITDASFIGLAEGHSNLHSLCMGCNENITDIGLIRIANGCPNLHSLYITDCINITNKVLFTLRTKFYSIIRYEHLMIDRKNVHTSNQKSPHLLQRSRFWPSLSRNPEDARFFLESNILFEGGNIYF
jgi:hypothetical protein